jgi:hypothetical protein
MPIKVREMSVENKVMLIHEPLYMGKGRHAKQA